MCNLHKYSTENLLNLPIDKNAARPEGKRAAKAQAAQGFSEMLNLVFINDLDKVSISRNTVGFKISDFCYAV